ncbi:DUF3300 domain-containing protein [Shewanella morhuae]|uniref:Protein of uncharacterized function (DUF3300) n=1 Tax=Shewanella morhuae TaxID=365591 RepID=A0A380B012_9GAMM|nr:DUF3300 domain-containing protein [Shewanella morhuae]SUI90833.1 Protein of uncharacterised function (DUF3300) [Shewanella morhuae]
MNRTSRWNWLVLTAALVTLPLTTIAQAAGVSMSQGSSATSSQAELEQMLAPIALYPDSLLTHILIASTYPLEIVQAQRWLTQRPNLSVDQIMSQADTQDWDPSVKALLAFPTLLQRMADDLNWTQGLGEAFLEDEGQVMNGIQSLRQQADKANSLANMDNMAITRANNQIIIEPAKREIVYVPYYDPRVVFGSWRWGAAYPPVYWEFSGYAGYPYRPRHNHFYWSPGIHISFNYFFSSFHWHSHKVVVLDYRHSHRYRPRERYSVSHGAQPWQHKPEHRRGVNYHNPIVKQRYYNDNKYRGRDSHSNGSNKHYNSQYSKSNERQNQHDKSRDYKDKQHNYDGREHDKRTPSYQKTQAELKERRSAPMVQAPTNKDRNEAQSRPTQSKPIPVKEPQQRQYQTRESQPRNVVPQRAQPQKQENLRTVTPRVETQRPEVRRAEPQRSQPQQRNEQQRIEQVKQPSAPKQREEMRVKQSEPRQNMQATRSVDHNQGRTAQSQERRHRE